MLGENYKEPSFEYDLVKAAALLNRQIEQESFIEHGIESKVIHARNHVLSAIGALQDMGLMTDDQQE